MDNPELASFLRTRREALQPEDVGLTRGPRRRTNGLRREEVADLAGMSADYYARLERGGGPHPSEQMVTAIARALRLSLAERDYLFLLTGHSAPRSLARGDHINPGLMRVLDRLQDTPAQILSGAGDTLAQTRLAIALFGVETAHVGLARSAVYRWFTDDAARLIYAAEDRDKTGRVFVAQLRFAATRDGADSRPAQIVDALLTESPEFARLWAEHEIGLTFSDTKRFDHPVVGRLDLNCQMLFDLDQSQALLVFTATPGSNSYEKLQLLGVIGSQKLDA
jgi:transcriptional regulator with XRE-family HTH domain